MVSNEEAFTPLMNSVNISSFTLVLTKSSVRRTDELERLSYRLADAYCGEFMHVLPCSTPAH